MDITIYPRKISGTVDAIPSKSQAHRILICAAFSKEETQIYCSQTNQDIEATVDCLRALGAVIRRTDNGYHVQPIVASPCQAVLPCRESGSTLRFMLPIVGALGVDAIFKMEGRLPLRPLSPLWEEMERMGCSLSRPTTDTISCRGRLRCGTYTISGSVSSQFITGLLFAMALLPGESTLDITGKVESAPYIKLTQQVLSMFDICSENFRINGTGTFRSPGDIHVEGDWSNAAFFLAAHSMGNIVTVTGLSDASTQGDKAVQQILNHMATGHVTVDAGDIPDLVPILSVAAAASHGAVFTNIARLRLKESDRVASVQAMLAQLGATVTADENTLRVFPALFRGCTIHSAGDHRIAMSAAIAATVAQGPVTIRDAHCVSKSYPAFWEDYQRLGGHYEQYIR